MACFPFPSVNSVYLFFVLSAFPSQYLVTCDSNLCKFRLLFICDLGLVVTAVAVHLLQGR
jgi:hypothetical protein